MQAPHHWCHKLWPSHDSSCHSSTNIHPLLACQCLPPCHCGGGKPCCVWCMLAWLLSSRALCHGILYCPSYRSRPPQGHLKPPAPPSAQEASARCLSIQVTYRLPDNAKQYMSTMAVPRKQHKHPPPHTPHTQKWYNNLKDLGNKRKKAHSTWATLGVKSVLQVHNGCSCCQKAPVSTSLQLHKGSLRASQDQTTMLDMSRAVQAGHQHAQPTTCVAKMKHPGGSAYHARQTDR